MTITWYGLSSFKINNSGNDVVIVTDPFDKSFGLTPPRGGADIVLISREDDKFSNIEGLSGNKLVIKNPGEFDIKGVSLRGIAPGSKSSEDGESTTIYHLEVDGLRIAFMGALKQSELTENQIDSLGNVDILLVPIGGGEVTNWEAASNIIQQIEPKVVIPYFYNQNGLSIELDTPEKFLKDMGVAEARTEDRLTLKAKDLPTEEKTEVILLTPQR